MFYHCICSIKFNEICFCGEVFVFCADFFCFCAEVFVFFLCWSFVFVFVLKFFFFSFFVPKILFLCRSFFSEVFVLCWIFSFFVLKFLFLCQSFCFLCWNFSQTRTLLKILITFECSGEIRYSVISPLLNYCRFLINVKIGVGYQEGA